MLFERLGLRPTWIDPEGFATSVLKTEEFLRRQTDALEVEDATKSLTWQYHLLATTCYLRDQIDRCRTAASRCLEACRQQFFGEWRSRVPERDAVGDLINLRTGQWEFSFEGVLVWGSVLHEWDRLAELSRYPDDDTPGDEEAGHVAIYYRAVAYLLSGRPGAVERLRAVRDGRSKKRRLLAEAILAILDGDEPAATAAVSAALKYHKERVFPQERLTAKLAEDVSFVVHFAERQGLPISVDPRYVDYVIRLPAEVAE